MKQLSAPGSWVRVMASLFPLAVTGWLVPATATATTAPAATVHVSSTGAGTSCTTASPCSLSAGLAKAGSGVVVEMAGGTYPDQRIADKPGAIDYDENVIVRPAPGAAVTVTRLSTRQPNVTFTGFTVRGVLYINPSAVGTRIDRMSVVGDGTFVRSTDVQLVNSVFEGGSSIDGIQIGRSQRVLLEDNIIRNFDQLGPGGLHADCIQLFDSSDVVIRRNRVSNCHNSAIIFSGGADKGIQRVLVESNFLQGCVIKSAGCNGGNVLDLRYDKAVDVTVVNNTMSKGTVRINKLPGLIVDRNIVNWLSLCGSPLTNSIIAVWNTGLCATPSAVGQFGTRTGKPLYVDEVGGDLHVRDAASVRVAPVVTVQSAPVTGSRIAPSGLDIDGEPYTAATAGADEPEPSTEVAPAEPTEAGSDEATSSDAEQEELTTDVVKPVVSLVSLANGSSLSGVVTVRIKATDNIGVSAVSLVSGGQVLGSARLASDGTWTFSVDTRKVRDGKYPVAATARDAAGNVATSAVASVAIRNAVTDTAKPGVSLVSPGNGASLSGVVTVRIKATDDVGVAGVSLFSERQFLGTARRSSDGTWVLSVDTRKVRNGRYPIAAKAGDAAGNAAASATAYVTVRNSESAAPDAPLLAAQLAGNLSQTTRA